MQSGVAMSLKEPNAEMFLTLETSLHRPDVRSSPGLVGNLLADEFIEFGSSGYVCDKQTTMKALAAEEAPAMAPSPQVSDFSVSMLSDNVVLVTYRSIRLSMEGQKGRQTLRSSIYKRFDGRWQMVFHQGTLVSSI
jgi:hypothetical protein